MQFPPPDVEQNKNHETTDHGNGETIDTTTIARPSYVWSAYYEEGRIYYYNSTTEESVWEPPPEGLSLAHQCNAVFIVHYRQVVQLLVHG